MVTGLGLLELLLAIQHSRTGRAGTLRRTG